MSGFESRAPLAGVRILEVLAGRAAAFAGMMLADLGAEVIKLETTLESSPSEAKALQRLAYDRGKRSVALDLSSSAGRAVLGRLLTTASAVLEDGETSSLSGLDLSSLVHCRITGYGGKPGPEPLDLIVQAISGCMDLTGEEGGPPFPMGIPLCDLGAGVYAAIGVLGALAGERVRVVEVARLDVAVALLSYMGVGYFADGEAPARVGTGHSTIFPYNSFLALDGEVVVAPFTQRFWRNFCSAIGRPDLPQMDRYRDFASRLRTKSELISIFEPILAQRSVGEWVGIFERADVPCGPVLDVAGALNLDQTLERGMTPKLADAGPRTPGSPFRFRFADGASYVPPLSPPPAAGQHTAEMAS